MTLTDAVNIGGDKIFTYPIWTMAVGDASGSMPTANADEFTDGVARRVVQAAGGSKLDYAEFEWILTDYLRDRNQPASFRKMLGVYLPNVEQTRLHVGDYVQEVEAVTQPQEALTGIVSMRSYHFGLPISGWVVYNELAALEDVITDHIVFNPMIDGKTRFNMSFQTFDGPSTARLWLHPEQIWTEEAESYHGGVPQEWTHLHAVLSLCELLNSDETVIVNPLEADISSILADAPPLRDVTLPLGAYLPQCLDRLLIPFGYNWYLDYERTGKPKIILFKIGVGTEKQLYLQEPGEVLDLEFSNVNQYQVSRAIGDSANQVRVLGDFERYEVTLPLLPAWPDADDSLTAEQLDKTDVSSQYKEHTLAWRQWVGNEAGDIAESRVFGTLDFEVPRLHTVFTTYVPHRRIIEEPITYVGVETTFEIVRERRPLFLEYSTDAGANWNIFPDTAGWTVLLLPDQIGILFDGAQPPAEIRDAGTAARVRITGVVTGDSRIEGLATRETWAANGRTVELVLDASDKFFFRQRQQTGDYASVLATVPGDGDIIDHTTDIQDYAEKIRDQNHHAEVDAEFRLPGWHIEYGIGDLITAIDGREINLDAAASGSPASRYPQIVERRFELLDEGQYTVLIVDRGTTGRT